MHPRLMLRSLVRLAATGLLASAVSATASAQSFPHGDGNGKLLLTGGVSSIEGAAGGGLTPWAVIGSYATEGETGVTAFATHARTQDFNLTVCGVAVGIHDRFEMTLARQQLDAGVVAPGARLTLGVAGMKLRVAGDAVLDADTWLPQVAVGLEFKHLDPGEAVGAVLDSVGARRDGVDLYVSATKLLLAQGVLFNGTLRATRANQNGLLGFGASDHGAYHLEPEVSVAWLLRRDVALGTEYRAKPNNLAFAGDAFREGAWKDLFISYTANKHVSFTAAYVDLGNIAGHGRQHGAYLSVQLSD